MRPDDLFMTAWPLLLFGVILVFTIIGGLISLIRSLYEEFWTLRDRGSYGRGRRG